MKYTVRHTCGHQQEHQIYGTDTRGQRQSRADWLATQPCPDCARADRAVTREAINAEATDHAADAGWPDLTGTPKQVAWANTLRRDALDALPDQIPGRLTDDQRQRVAAIVQAAGLRQTHAAWWIDNRDHITRALAQQATTAAERQEAIDISKEQQ